jgi:hypothetical protein
MGTRENYLAAASAFADVAERTPADAWDGPGLGTWRLRELAGHTVSSGLDVVRVVLTEPATQRDVASPQDYYALARTVDPQVYQGAVAASTDSARRAGAALGDEPAAVIRPLVDEVAAVLSRVGDDDLVQTRAGGMRVVDWLSTRVFELAVHTLDLATGAGVPAAVPDEVIADAAALAARIGASVGDGTTVVLALTGRRSLPDGFSVL